jgi:hypothetical protein
MRVTAKQRKEKDQILGLISFIYGTEVLLVIKDVLRPVLGYRCASRRQCCGSEVMYSHL